MAADSVTALKLISRAGVIVWDDYVRGWPGVVAAVDELGCRSPPARGRGSHDMRRGYWQMAPAQRIGVALDSHR